MSTPETVTVERQAGIILDNLRHFVAMAKGRARTKRGEEDIDMEGTDILRTVGGLFWRLGILPRTEREIEAEARASESATLAAD